MLMVSKPNKIILNSIAQAKGISIDEAKLALTKNKTKKKTRRKKKKATDPSVEIISSGLAKSVDFSQVKGRTKRSEARENVLDWDIKDVAFYIRSKYEKKYNSDWGHRVIGTCPELRRIHDRILDLYGHCDFLVMRDYVDFVFEEYIDGMIDKVDGVFYLRNFRDDRFIVSFSESYDYKESFERATRGEEKTEKAMEGFSTSSQSIEEIFYLSEDSFVTTYGIVVCIFWLIKCQGYTNKEAATTVLDICQRLNKKGDFKSVKERTEFLSPYHESINFPKMEEFLKNIDGRYKIDIQYKENDIIKSKFKFLEEQV